MKKADKELLLTKAVRIIGIMLEGRSIITKAMIVDKAYQVTQMNDFESLMTSEIATACEKMQRGDPFEAMLQSATGPKKPLKKGANISPQAKLDGARLSKLDQILERKINSQLVDDEYDDRKDW